ncbi:MAG: hypothetical protein NTW86_30155, partial [Candidatus Sumerlaeota bacterium]|nr:hypothetical protein [Candidatus Sumerlaeota bacterium]
LEEYRDRPVMFVLQNWEGDWMLRGTGVAWERDPKLVPLNIDQKIQGMIRLFQARQRGVERARAEVKDTKARVSHAVEVNKIWNVKEKKPMMECGVPTVLAGVVPHVRPDMVSWSAYDGLWDMPVSFWQGIELIRHYTPPSPLLGRDNVVIGEIGLPERDTKKTPEQIAEFWDQAVGVIVSFNIPYMLHWELYCNEWKDKNKLRTPPPDEPPAKAEDLRGFWLIRPDGSDSYAGAYFRRLLQCAGATLSTERDIHEREGEGKPGAQETEGS